MYKKALRTKLRFSTSKGKLTTEDLFDLHELIIIEVANEQKSIDEMKAKRRK